MFGGQGFASSRNPLSLQSSKKLFDKSVVYLQHNPHPVLPILSPLENRVVDQSVFAAFTRKKFKQSTTAELNLVSVSASAKISAFLKKNDLLKSTKVIGSSISGHVMSRKYFADNWNFSTRPPNGNQGCLTGATLNGNVVSTFDWNTLTFPSFTTTGSGGTSSFTLTSFSCAIAGVGYGNQASSIDANAINAQCQAFHMACDQQPLPVELIKFEVD